MVGSDSLLHGDGTGTIETNVVADGLDRSSGVGERAIGKLAAPESDGGTFQDVVTSLPLLTADVLGLTAAYVAMEFIGSVFVDTNLDFRLLPAVLCAQLAVFFVVGLYPACGLHPYTEFREIAKGLLFANLTLVLFHAFVFDLENAFRLCCYACLGLPLVSAFRSVARKCCAGSDWWMQPAIVFDASSRLEREFRLNPTRGIRPIRISDPAEMASYPARRLIAANQSIAEVERSRSSHYRLILELPNLCGPATVANYRNNAIELECVDRVAIPIVGFVKRCFDLTLIAVTAPVWLLVVLVLSLCVRVTSRGSIFFGQKRIGINGKSFYAWKFRTMVPDADKVLLDCLESEPKLRDEWESTHKLRNDPRVTAIGRFLRCTSLDELPQLWNVLIGEMSLVGPRPIIDSPAYDREYVEDFPNEFQNYCRVPPGITGLWQVMGRNHTSYERRIQLDDFYVRNWSFSLDLYILFRTIKTVLLREGAY